ncbi:hypothetical protein [Actinocatenispora sera]|uniref:Uncharacterized protein n=1 Tax=Actinocatenispora sera TaxID=390989 RepID=A0A810LA17_9ACTN|nr:hypothetical protein [Actinocatenispora sera]BCJ32410.1 hypothetical protein Asera_65180 [Actinocatenispora sera]
MSEDAPTRVGFWSYATGVGRKVAEFTRQPDGSVAFRVLDRSWAGPAQDYYDNGVPVLAGGARIPATVGDEFLRALLQPFRMTYYGFLDESDALPAAASGAAPDRQAADSAGDQASDLPLTGVSDPDAVQLRPIGPARGLSVEDAYRVLSGLPPGPVEVPPLPDERRDRP